MPDIESKLILRQSFGLFLSRFEIKEFGQSERGLASIHDFKVGDNLFDNLRKEKVFLWRDHSDASFVLFSSK